MLTNRAVAYIKKRKYKEAIIDCEQALFINPKFAKAHLRAHTCYLFQGFLEKSKESLLRYIEETPESGAADQQKVKVLDELMKYEKFSTEALQKKEYREASFYATKLMEHCPDSIKHLCLKLESDISGNPNDM